MDERYAHLDDAGRARSNGQGYDFSGPTQFDKLLAGIVVDRPAFIVAALPRAYRSPSDA